MLLPFSCTLASFHSGFAALFPFLLAFTLSLYPVPSFPLASPFTRILPPFFYYFFFSTSFTTSTLIPGFPVNSVSLLYLFTSPFFSITSSFSPLFHLFHSFRLPHLPCLPPCSPSHLSKRLLPFPMTPSFR